MVGLIPTGAESQSAHTIQDAPLCPACSIEIRQIALLGERDGEGFVGEPLDFAATPSGGWYLTHTSDPSSVFEFSADGQFVRRLGRRGDGPGEFRRAGQILEVSPALRIIDVFGNRLVTFDSSGVSVRTARLPALNANDVAATLDDQLVIAGVSLGGGDRSLPLHFTDGARIVRSFGELSGSDGSRSPQRTVRWIDAGPSVWAAHMLQYRLEEWSTDGELVQVLERAPAWFPAGETMNRTTEEPVPMIVGIRMIDGLLWVVSRVPDEEWASAIGDHGDSMQGPTIESDKYWDSIIEVVDVRARRVVASARVDQALMRPRADGTTASYSEDELGYPFVHIWEMTLTR